MTRLLIVRHGECQAHVDGIVAGALHDSPLTEVGVLQAEEIAGMLMLRRKKFDRIVSSNLSRALDTAKILKRLLDFHKDIEVDERFTERNVGDATGMKIEEYFALEKLGTPINGSEHEKIMYMRVKEGLKAIRDNGRDTLLVTHNGTYRMIKCILSGKSYQDFAMTEGLEKGKIQEVKFS